MNTFLLVLALTLPVIIREQTPFSVPPPTEASTAHATKKGTCDVTFDASGHVAKVSILQSTGSAALDANTLDFARKNWTGQPNSRVEVPVYYKLNGPLKPLGGVFTPIPPYPYQARARHEAGAGQVRVTFNSSGCVSKGTMAKSTGSDLLDANTIKWAQAQWTGKPNTSILVPVAYRLQ